LANWLTDARTLASPAIVILLVGNKKDLDQEREVTFLEASRFAQVSERFIASIKKGSAIDCVVRHADGHVRVSSLVQSFRPALPAEVPALPFVDVI